MKISKSLLQYQVILTYNSYQDKHTLISKLSGRRPLSFYTCSSVLWYYKSPLYARKMVTKLRKIKRNRKWIKSVDLYSVWLG